MARSIEDGNESKLTTSLLVKKIALGTKHKKEQVIRPQFLMHLGASLIVPDEMDTDTLGTFTGEIEREGSAYDTVVKKAEWAMKLIDLPMGFANEGSFGPHPEIGLIPSNSEWMIFIDRERDLAVTERLLTTKTNFAHASVHNTSEATDFLTTSMFPSHGLIVRPHVMIQSCSTLMNVTKCLR